MSSYNILFNGTSSIEKGVKELEESYKENFWDVIPVEKIKLSGDIITVDGIENSNFLKAEEKAAKTIQKHSMIINGMQMNPKIANAYLLLGKARYLDQRFVQALDAFNQVYKETIAKQLWNESVIWKAKANIRLEQEAVAIEMLKNILKTKKINGQNKANANAALSMAYLQLNEDKKAINTLKIASETETNKENKARYMYILGQLYEKQSKLDSSNIYFKKVAQFHRKIPRELYLNAKLKTLIHGSVDFNEKELQILKMIGNYENDPFLDKIYYGYSMVLFSNDLISSGKNYLNKAIRENGSDKDLKSRGYAKIANIYFQNSNYLLAGKYLDSTLLNLDKNSKQFWEKQRQKRGLSQIVELENKILLTDSLIRISYYNKQKLNKIISTIKSSQIKTETQNPKNRLKNLSSILRKSSFKKSNFYFYDYNLIKLGKESFKSLWGERSRGSYWRNNKNKVLSVVESEVVKKENVSVKTELTLTNASLLASVPFTKSSRDSVKKTQNQTYLKLAELYLVKYKDYASVEIKLKKLIESNPRKDILAEANYLLFKLYNITNKKKSQKTKTYIINNFPETKFSKILKNSNDLVYEENILIKRLDSLNILFENQEFEKIIKRIQYEIDFIDNKELSFDFELLKASSIGRLEGILEYKEQLSLLLEKYPNANRKNEIQKIINTINKKWENKNEKTFFGKYQLVYVMEKKDDQEKILEKVVSLVDENSRVSIDVYDYDKCFLVVKDFESKDKAEEIKRYLGESVELLKLKNNFVVLSSQYKNMLIYKTLDLYRND